MQQAEDFREESRVLAAVLEPLTDGDFFIPTQFKGWTIDDILGHLHIFNHAAALALKSDEAFHSFFADMKKVMQSGGSMIDAQRPWIGGLKGRALFEAWLAMTEAVADGLQRLTLRHGWLGLGRVCRRAPALRRGKWKLGHMGMRYLTSWGLNELLLIGLKT